MKKAISRRDFLKVVGVSAAALGMTACGGSSASTSTAASSTAASSAAASAAGAGEGGSGNDFTLTWNEVNGEDYGATVGAHTFAEKIEELIAQRAAAKKEKNFAEADRIRDELKAQGVEVTDMPGGAKWKRV